MAQFQLLEDHEDLSANLPDPPNTVRSHEQLLELLSEGMQGELEPVADQEWIDIRQEVRNRLAQRSQ